MALPQDNRVVGSFLGLLDVNHDGLPRVRNSRCRGFSFRVPEPSADSTAAPACSWVDDLADGPDEADQLACDSDRGDGRSLAATGHSVELSIQALVASFGDVE